MANPNYGNRDLSKLRGLVSNGSGTSYSNSSRKTYSQTEYDEEDEDEEEYEEKPNIFFKILTFFVPTRDDEKPEIIRKCVLDVAIIAFLIIGISILSDVVSENIQTDVVDKKLAALYDENADDGVISSEMSGNALGDDENAPVGSGGWTYNGEVRSSFAELYAINSDIVGWIRVGTPEAPIINYPVVQAADNDYYLTRNFYGETVKRGAIFADYRNKFEDGELSGNTVIYGHNMWNGDTMFAKLSRYYDGGVVRGESDDYLSFYKEHPTVTFNTLFENAEWKVFGCVLFNTQKSKGEVYQYNNILEFDDEDSFNNFIIDIMNRSVLWTDVDLKYGDKILTLSTCYYPYGKNNADTRVAVFARKVRPGESTEVDVTKAVRNYDPIKFAFQYQVEGGSWGGTKWDTSKLIGYVPAKVEGTGK